MHPWQGSILQCEFESHRVPRSRGLSLCTALPAPRLVQPNTDWVKSSCWSCATHTAPRVHTHTQLWTGLGTASAVWHGGLVRYHAAPQCPPSLAVSLPDLTLEPHVGWGRRCWYGTRPVCGVTVRAKGHLVSPMACLETSLPMNSTGMVVLGWLSVCSGFGLFPAVPGSCRALGGSGKCKLPFLGRLDQRESLVRF